MPSVLIRNVDDALHRCLKERAASHRRSLEEEARELLRLAVASRTTPARENLADSASRLFSAAHGAELILPARGCVATPTSPDFGGDYGGEDGIACACSTAMSLRN
jgi:plasmid stability protein